MKRSIAPLVLIVSALAGARVWAVPFSVDGSTLYITGGNVGIGTTSPGTSLDVAGGVTIRGQETITSTLTVLGGTIDGRVLNIAGGSIGNIPYQAAAGATQFQSTFTMAGGSLTIDHSAMGNVAIMGIGAVVVGQSKMNSPLVVSVDSANPQGSSGITIGFKHDQFVSINSTASLNFQESGGPNGNPRMSALEAGETATGSGGWIGLSVDKNNAAVGQVFGSPTNILAVSTAGVSIAPYDTTHARPILPKQALEVYGNVVIGGAITTTLNSDLTVHGSTLTVGYSGIVAMPSQPRARATLQNATPIPPNVSSHIYWDTNNYNKQSMHSVSVSSDQFVVPSTDPGGGSYCGYAQVDVGSALATNEGATLIVTHDDGDVVCKDEVNGNGGAGGQSQYLKCGPFEWQTSANHYFYATFIHTHSANIDIGAGQAKSYMMVRKCD